VTALAGRLWAIAMMTLLEASRRKVFVILILFAVAILSSTLFFPAVDMDGRLRLIEIWSLRAAALFTAIIGLFLAGFSLPTDFEQKRIYLLVTKPVSKAVLFLGRFLGYVFLLAIFVAVMGAITILFLRTVGLFSGPKFPALVAYPRFPATAFDHRGGAEITGSKEKYQIDAELGRALVWRFKGLHRSAFPEPEIRARMLLSLGARNDPFRAAGTVKIRVVNPAGENHPLSLSLNTNEEGDFAIPSRLIGEAGAFDVEISAGDADGIISGAESGVLLYGKSMSFEAAFARGMALVLLQSIIVLSLTLMASTFLSAPLSILLGVFLYVVGSIHGYVQEGARDIDRSLGELRPMGKQRTPENIPVPILKISSATSQAVLAAVPDFADFDFSTWLLKDHAVSWRELADAARKALWPVLALLLLGMLVMTFKDFG
jgi:hypothetical protein